MCTERGLAVTLRMIEWKLRIHELGFKTVHRFPSGLSHVTLLTGAREMNRFVTH